MFTLACLIYKHNINITLFSFELQETFFQWRGITRKERDTRVKKPWVEYEQLLEGMGRGMVDDQPVKQLLLKGEKTEMLKVAWETGILKMC